jgi:hypothetical protein
MTTTETTQQAEWARQQALKALAGAKAAMGLAGTPLPPIVCLCGSTRFYDAFQRANYDLTMTGRIVLSVGFYPHAKAEHGHGEGVGHDSAEKAALDELHKRKIDLADEVLVVSDETGYFGESTRSEIEYAYRHGKPVTYLWRAAEDRADELGIVPEVAF